VPAITIHDVQENFKYEVQEKSPANQAITMQQLAEEYWR
jgi:hypothetical protein